MPTAAKKVLAENLRQLQQDGVLVRADFSNALLHGEYSEGAGCVCTWICTCPSQAFAGLSSPLVAALMQRTAELALV
jgi:hypothetical protein